MAIPAFLVSAHEITFQFLLAATAECAGLSIERSALKKGPENSSLRDPFGDIERDSKFVRRDRIGTSSNR